MGARECQVHCHSGGSSQPREGPGRDPGGHEHPRQPSAAGRRRPDAHVGRHLRRRPRPRQRGVAHVRALAEAHARIVSIDVDEAKAAPGVIAVFTGDDLAELGLAPNVNPELPRRRCAVRSWPSAPCGTSASPSSPSSPRTATRRPTRPSSCSSTTTRCPPSSIRRRAPRDEVLLFPDVGTNVVQRWPREGAGRLQRVRSHGGRAHRQPADDRGADRAARGRGVLDRRRPPRALLGVPGRAPDHATCWPRIYGLDPATGAGDRSRRRWRLRRQVAHLSRGAGARLLRRGPVGRPVQVDRDPLGEHGGDAPRARAGAASQARRHPRRAHHRLPPRRGAATRARSRSSARCCR